MRMMREPAEIPRPNRTASPSNTDVLRDLREQQGQIATPASVSGEATQPFTPPTHDAVAFAPPSVEELVPKFPQLEINELIGAGGMGAVYKARQLALNRPVALKILPATAARDTAFSERFALEARMLARLDHPHIVDVYDFGEADGVFYLLMEYVDGLDLRRALHSKALSPDDALALVPQICDALQYAHDEGVVHRDIKPENILLDRKGQVKIADFGLAKLLGEPGTSLTLTAPQQIMGTPRYMAPEQVEATRDVDHRADIYSLGVVFYEMLTGELPLGCFARPSEKASIDARLDDIVLRALAKEPGQRYQQASDLKSGVEIILSDSSAALAANEAAQAAKAAAEAAAAAETAAAQIPLTPPADPSVALQTSASQAAAQAAVVQAAAAAAAQAAEAAQAAAQAAAVSAVSKRADPSSLVCAILAVLLLMSGVIAPLILFAFEAKAAIAISIFAAMQGFATFLGILGRRHQLGRYAALGAILLLSAALAVGMFFLRTAFPG
jgi:hypothetical protein